MSSVSRNREGKCMYNRPKRLSLTRYCGKGPISAHNSQPLFLCPDSHQPIRTSRGLHISQSMDHRYGCIPSLTNRLHLLQLRSFDQLSVERSYLFNILQHEDFKATE